MTLSFNMYRKKKSKMPRTVLPKSRISTSSRQFSIVCRDKRDNHLGLGLAQFQLRYGTMTSFKINTRIIFSR